jgi:hypothetical protein
LNRARDEKDSERRRGDREHAAGGEDRDAKNVDRSPPIVVGELGHHRDRDDVREQVQREDPGELAGSDAELRAKRGERRRKDTQIEGAGEDTQPQRDQQRDRAAVEAVARDACRRGVAC